MDWTPYMSGFFALGGIFAGIFGSVWVQRIIQKNETARHARKLAYDAAFVAWREYREKMPDSVDTQEVEKVPPLDDFIIHHLIYADATLNIRIGTANADIERIIRTNRERSYFLVGLRRALFEEGRHRVIGREKGA